MLRRAVIAILASPSLATAQPGVTPDAPPPAAALAPVASPLEPGTLGRGDFAGRFGVGLGNGPLGLGAEVALGLGGVDLLASVGYLPQFCVNLGELGGGCDPALVFVGSGMQAMLRESGPVRFGMRVKGDASITGDRTGLLVAGVGASTGGSAVRVSLGAVTAGWYEEDDPFEENGWYVGPEVGLQYLRGHAGGAVTVGYGFPLTGQPKPMPLVSATAVWR